MVRRSSKQTLSIILLVFGIVVVFIQTAILQQRESTQDIPDIQNINTSVLATLEELPIKGKAPKTGYSRTQFGSGWRRYEGCDMRNTILARDMIEAIRDEKCRVVQGRLVDPYTGAEVAFIRGVESSQAVQIDHIVSLSNAWQTGAQQLTSERRATFANDPLNLIAVDGRANQAKGDGDAATWLPANKSFRCEYIERQVRVKYAYELWVTKAEKEAMTRVLNAC